MPETLEKTIPRKPQYAVDPVFVKRWSPRAMSGEGISDGELMSLFEAARWAPSSYNNQSWRFIYAKRESPEWGTFFQLLSENNRQWAKNAAALIVIVSKTTFDHNGEPARTHTFDTGAAWQNLALQASISGLAAHGMEGFDYDKARESLAVPADYNIEAMAAIGRPGNPADLPPALRDREFPSDRKKVDEIVFAGKFKTDSIIKGTI